ncbi:helix-turn-helix domain-containing protein [Bifidobacterium aerophilum]|uniref:Helix-turn-helix domain-containing protein n=1 Tax=Bifidobacterium aerophilum TaxID=1798155 RepID=A0A6N9Z265_9BIFI|nr:helix-turn-helix domain-containing protein [Bifidobacterium aerophilum]NEG88600.1 helix-turn-helix domain-containing protein [Bifidobacterium aerophilum]
MTTDVLTVAPAFSEIAGQLAPLNTAEKVSEVVGIPVNTLNDWRTKGKNLRFVKLGRAIYYRRDDVLDYLQSQVFNSTAEAKAASAGGVR